MSVDAWDWYSDSGWETKDDAQRVVFDITERSTEGNN
jgi:hypothetical protein